MSSNLIYENVLTETSMDVIVSETGQTIVTTGVPATIVTSAPGVGGAGAGAGAGAVGGSLELGRRLLLAARAGDTNQVLDLMAKGAPFTTDWLGTSPLHLAAAGAHVATCGVLLRAGVSRDARTKVERTPLHMAAAAGHARAAALLLRHGAAADARDLLHMTPLHWAAERDHPQVVAALLAYGADVTAVSKFRKTPRHLAARRRHQHVLDLLDKHHQLALTRPLRPDPLIEEQTSLQTFVTVQKVEDIKTDNLKSVYEKPLRAAASLQHLNTQHNQIQSDIIELNTEGVAEQVMDHEETILDQSAESVEEEIAIETPPTVPRGRSRLAGAPGGQAGGAAALLEKHGITFLPPDNGSTVLSALQSGRSVVLSDAGKLLLQQSTPLLCVPSPSPSPQGAAPSPAPVVLRATPVRSGLGGARPGGGRAAGGGGGTVKVFSVKQPRLARVGDNGDIEMQRVKLVKMGSPPPAGARRPPVKIIMNKSNFQRLVARAASPPPPPAAPAPAPAAAPSPCPAPSPPSEAAELRRQLSASQRTVARLTEELRLCRARLAVYQQQ